MTAVRIGPLLAFCVLLASQAACAGEAINSPALEASPAAATQRVLIHVDGRLIELDTAARTVGEVLLEAEVGLSPADRVSVDPTATLAPSAGSVASVPQQLSVIRVTEEIETIPEAIPFERRIVRSAEHAPDDPPRIIQAGRTGIQEVTLRIVYEDGLEVDRYRVGATVVEPPQAEILLVGIGSAPGARPITGTLAFNSGGRAIVVEGSTESPRQLALPGRPDGRVFVLSPDGRYLLVTIAPGDGDSSLGFRNELWIIPTADGRTAIPTNIENVLTAVWDPSALATPRLAYTTARSTNLPPGWEANNDLWIVSLADDDSVSLPTRLVDSYPATLGWWGGRIAWSPDGAQLAYAFAEEVGTLILPPSLTGDVVELAATANQPTERAIVAEFDAFETGGDWVWLPPLAWTSGGEALSFAAPGTEPAEAERISWWGVGGTVGDEGAALEDVGLWTQGVWSPVNADSPRQFAFLRAASPQDESSYHLWLAGAGQPHRIYPPEGENSYFPRADQSLAWSPDGHSLAFIFADTVYIFGVDSAEVYQFPSDDTVASHPSWAPYGARP